MHESLSQHVIVKVPYYRVTTTKLITWFKLDGYTRKTDMSAASLLNLADNKVKGKISKKSSKKMKGVIDNWVSAIEFKMDRKKRREGTLGKYITFVTLTLPATQFHEDKYMRRHLLNDFIRKMKEQRGVRNYLHCSEAQGNGNIHFHIVVDRYIDHKKLREDWNGTLDNHGYIDKFEAKHGHRNPNSTDIHSFRKVRSIANYLVKYFTKDLNRRPIEGRLWGCSDLLREAECFNDLVDSRLEDMVAAMVDYKRFVQRVGYLRKKDVWFRFLYWFARRN